ncbi:flavin monoamine oxidase family protein [Pseudarthrobacter chlorophenolicus]|uniref:flavin monoamine oxidase family protein n=1 Tax=Pseudarthrobacter chlorophenolicus TaxID=85085 RepID=UPI0005F2F420|nr:FAD-dependent oxidoreductase [Pseudarthrobacter chlorophenolicus]
MHDVIIVGAGAAGLGTAYYLRDSGLDVLVLESGQDIGGRSHTVQLSGTPANSGAMFVYKGTNSEKLVHELGIETVPFLPTTYGIHVNGKTVVSRTNEDVVAGLNLTGPEKTELTKFIDDSLTEYQDYVSDRTTPSELHRLSDETVAERIAGLLPAVRDIIATAIRGGAVGDPANLSAKYAMRYFASYLARERDNRLYAVKGMQEIPRAMLRQLPAGTVRCDARVTGVAPLQDRDGYAVSVAGGAGGQELTAKHVVLAVPAPVVPHVVGNLPEWKVAALERVACPGSTTLNIVANIEGLPEFRDWAFVVTVGMPFDAIINPVPGGDGGSEKNILQLTCYGNSSGYLPGFGDDRERIAEWMEHVYTVAPELRGRVIGVHAQTWQHCFALLSPERAGALPELQRSIGSLHFAGDYTSETAGTHGAYAEAERVAAQIRAALKPDC